VARGIGVCWRAVLGWLLMSAVDAGRSRAAIVGGRHPSKGRTAGDTSVVTESSLSACAGYGLPNGGRSGPADGQSADRSGSLHLLLSSYLTPTKLERIGPLGQLFPRRPCPIGSSTPNASTSGPANARAARRYATPRCGPCRCRTRPRPPRGPRRAVRDPGRAAVAPTPTRARPAGARRLAVARPGAATRYPASQGAG